MRSAFQSIPVLFLEAPDSELHCFLAEADRHVRRYPAILARIEADQNRAALEKKKLRLLDKQWHQQQEPRLPTMQWSPAPIDDKVLGLGTGRPRLSPYLVYMFMLGRGFFGGFKSSQATTLLFESVTFLILLANLGLRRPDLSTLCENVNAVSNETRSFILDTRILAVLHEGLDDLESLTVDSTDCRANSCWPAESKSAVDLAARIHRRCSKVDRFGLPDVCDPQTPARLKQMARLHKHICLCSGKPNSKDKRDRHYLELLALSRKCRCTFEQQVGQLEAAAQHLSVPPSQFEHVRRILEWLHQDLENLQKVIDCCHARVVEQQAVPMKDKVLSVSDPDCAYITKGGREATIGYKPQIGRSHQGFITSLLVPRGNAADVAQLIPIVEESTRRTGRLPSEVSTDDGYACAASRQHLLDMGVQVVSINGSKGRSITDTSEWETEAYAEARRYRSAVESLMFTIKDGFDFGRLMRRGIDNVRAELTEKAIAYNLCRILVVRNRMKRKRIRRAA